MKQRSSLGLLTLLLFWMLAALVLLIAITRPSCG
jgi:hypothetical protein